MSDAVTLRSYAGEADAAAERIAAFRLAHSDYVQTREEALGDLRAWTSDGHRFYFLDAEGAAAGFAHLGSRGGEFETVRSDELLGHSFDVRRKRAPSSDTESTGGEGNHVVS